ncbi:MAG: phosphodiester glycosidase family protein [Chitinophagaceae bacterium]|nr:phosphodiester glycosidase family protein [Chitinophagaceae bacterium]
MFCIQINYFLIFLLLPPALCAQVNWINVDSFYSPLPSTVQVFKTTDLLDGKPNIAYYTKSLLKDRKLDFTTDTSSGRRLKPAQFYQKNGQPLIVVNASFFNFDKHQNLNIVIRNGQLLAYNIHSLPMRGKDTLKYRHPLGSAIGIDKRRRADIVWTLTDSAMKYAYASQYPAVKLLIDSLKRPSKAYLESKYRPAKDSNTKETKWVKWKMRTAVGGGPVLVQAGKVMITNEQEAKFAGKALQDKHPRTLMGYTADGHLIIMAIQGRFPGIAEGATLEQCARLMIGVGCVEAINLDGGGSSCLLVNGKETIKPSDKEGERAVPAVFLINEK